MLAVLSDSILYHTMICYYLWYIDRSSQNIQFLLPKSIQFLLPIFIVI